MPSPHATGRALQPSPSAAADLSQAHRLSGLFMSLATLLHCLAREDPVVFHVLAASRLSTFVYCILWNSLRVRPYASDQTCQTTTVHRRCWCVSLPHVFRKCCPCIGSVQGALLVVRESPPRTIGEYLRWISC